MAQRQEGREFWSWEEMEPGKKEQVVELKVFQFSAPCV